MSDEGNPYDAPGEDDVFVAPPTERDEFDDVREPPKWPKVVGIISIVWGTLSMLCTGGGTAMSALSGRLIQSSGISGPLPPMLTSPPVTVYISAALSLALSLFLIVAGAVTASRKPTGRTLHLVYAVVALLVAVWATSLQLGIQNDLAEWLRQHPDSDYTKMTQTGATAIGTAIGIAFGLVIGFTWPIFTLIWFGAVKTKPEQMTGGVAAPAA